MNEIAAPSEPMWQWINSLPFCHRFQGECCRVNGIKYYKPRDIKEACSRLASADLSAKPLAGGTDLLVQLRRGKITPGCLVDLKSLGFDEMTATPEGGLRIGALCTLNTVLSNKIVDQRYPILAESIAELASVQIRHRATLGGNLCNASPAADTAPPLLALDARVSIAGINGTREVLLADFFQGPGQTSLFPGEIVTEIVLPARPERSGGAYLKAKRTAMDLALVGVAVHLSVENDERCGEAKIFLGAVAPTPLFAPRASESLRKASMEKKTIGEVAALAAEEARPIDDVRASAWYRKRLIKVLTERAILTAYSRAIDGAKTIA